MDNTVLFKKNSSYIAQNFELLLLFQLKFQDTNPKFQFISNKHLSVAETNFHKYDPAFNEDPFIDHCVKVP